MRVAIEVDRLAARRAGRAVHGWQTIVMSRALIPSDLVDELEHHATGRFEGAGLSHSIG